MLLNLLLFRIDTIAINEEDMIVEETIEEQPNTLNRESDVCFNLTNEDAANLIGKKC